MADIRAFVILNPRFLSYERESTFKRLLGDCRMAVRRFVLRTNSLPSLRALYSAAYRFHIWALLLLLRRYKGTRAVYLTSGMGRGEVRHGISDIDIVVFGDWPDKRQMRLVALLAVLIMVFPLLDRESLGRIQTWQDFLDITNTNLYLAYQYAFARRDWKLLWGEDLIQGLPDLLQERRGGASYMEVRRWWVQFAKMAFGENVTSRDPVFRNSISFKAVADILRAEAVAHGDMVSRSRVDRLRQGLGGEDEPLLRQLLQSEAAQFLPSGADLRAPSATWLLQHIERIHTSITDAPSFRSVAPFEVHSAGEDRLIAPATALHVEQLANDAARWEGFRAAYLLPSAQFITPDTLGLFLECDPGKVPSFRQLRALCALHLQRSGSLTQRVRVYLLLERGAYLLDFLFGNEIWGGILIPQTNPDIFTQLSRSEFILRGPTRSFQADARWSLLAQQQLEEELMIRRAAHARSGVTSRSAVDNLRNFWRYLQLLAMAQPTQGGRVTIPSTVAATRRVLTALFPELAHPLYQLDHAMRAAAEGQPIKADDLIQKVYLSQALQRLDPRPHLATLHKDA